MDGAEVAILDYNQGEFLLDLPRPSLTLLKLSSKNHLVGSSSIVQRIFENCEAFKVLTFNRFPRNKLGQDRVLTNIHGVSHNMNLVLN